ncbi:MAG: hypothetical protein IM628_10645 [Phenylobacterium sp.]|uniref:phage regulatory CII family protein n=1 Tax=Phenylobacterium sp. TaxID=1871053 RepID=UPI0025CD70CF|nr:phage regulatory CII family protein [Phenylobacterium sp.]MCA6305259.1 hypothetical protein [Phenylobacterium sp.]
MSDVSLKAAFRQLVAAVGGVDGAAAACRVRRSQLADCASANSAQFAAIDVVADLEAAAGAPTVTRELARLSGHDLVPAAPPAADAPPADPARWVVRLSAHLGELATEVESVTADGRIDAGERARLIECLQKVRDAAVRKIELLRAKNPRVEGGR